MPPPPALVFSHAEGFRFRTRAFGFLEDGDELNARQVFDGLEGNERQMVRTRIDHWLDRNIYDEYFHGWPNDPSWRGCFVFRWKKKRQPNRLYGFICHPRPTSDSAFELCVLLYHDTKNQWETEERIVNRVKQFERDLRTREAIAIIYPEFKGRQRWAH